MFGRRQITLMN